MRGLSAGFQGGQSSASIAPFPNVATYLDEQSMQFPNRNLDIYMVDMQNIEVDEGPQGTLFGGGAEAGADSSSCATGTKCCPDEYLGCITKMS